MAEPKTPSDLAKHDLGFDFLILGETLLSIRRQGREVTVLRNKAALKARQQLENADFPTQQQLMARLTGNYKRGNERS